MPKKTIINIGDKFTNVDGLEFEIIAFGDNYRYVCQFTESGYKTEATSGVITKGRVIDLSVPRIIEIGKIYQSNSGLDFIVLNKTHGNYYNIRFLESGYETEVNSSAINKGRIRDYITNPEINPGDVYTNNSGYDYTVLEKLPNGKFKIRFNNTGFEIETHNSDIHSGKPEDRLEPSLYGVGILGYKPNVSYKEYKRYYMVWSDMIGRCYNQKDASYSRYGANGVYVSERWKRFDYFLEDIPYVDGYDKELFESGQLQLDKDLKQYGIYPKIYSLETCTFLPNIDNSRLASANDIIAISSNKTVIAKSLRDMESKVGIPNASIYNALNKGYERDGYRFYSVPAYIIPAIINKKLN